MLKVKVQKQQKTKLGKVWNVSLAPIKSCRYGVPCATEKSCYALKAYRLYPNTKTSWDHNLDLWLKNPEVFERTLLETFTSARALPKLFRWLVSGDIVDAEFMNMIHRVACVHKEVPFLVFTKRYDLVNQYYRVMSDANADIPLNLSIVFSAWPGLEMNNPHKFPVAYMDDGREEIPATALPCPGRCDECAMCWHLAKRGIDVVFEKH